MANSTAQPENYNKPWPLSYGAPPRKDLNAQYQDGQGVNKSVWPTSNELENKVSGTTATIKAKEAGAYNTLGKSDKSEIIHSKVATDSIKESSKSKIF